MRWLLTFSPVEEVVDLQKTLSLVRGKKKYTSNHLIRLMSPMSSASRASAIFPIPGVAGAQVNRLLFGLMPRPTVDPKAYSFDTDS